MTRRATTVLVLVCALAMGAPMVAAAASSGTAAQAISDCNDHSTLTQHYSPSVLRQALAQMPVDVKEYTDCYDVIERQLFKELGKSSPTGSATGSSSGSSFPTWLIVVIVVLALAALTFAAMAIRRRSGGPGDPGAPGGPGSAGPGGGGPGAGPPSPPPAT